MKKIKHKNYVNPHTKDGRIYSTKDIYNMSVWNVFRNKEEILSQNKLIGVPDERELRSSENVIWVDEYTRDDGTKVCGHWRSKPDGGRIPINVNKSENLSNVILERGIDFVNFPNIGDIIKQIVDKIQLPEVNGEVVKKILTVASAVSQRSIKNQQISDRLVEMII